MGAFGKPKDADEFEVDGLDEADSKFHIPEGEYEAVCIDLEKAESKAGNPMWVFTFAIRKGDHEGHELKMFCAQTDAAKWRSNEVLEALGVKIKDGRAKFKKADILNVMVGIVVEDNEYEGRTNSSIKSVHPHETPGKKIRK